MKPKRAIIEAKALRFGGVTALVAGLVATAIFWGQLIPLFGRFSIGSLASTLAAGAACLGFLTTGRSKLHHGSEGRLRAWITDGALALTHAGIGLLLTIAAFYLAQNAFEGLRLDYWTAAIISGLTVGMVGYASYLSGLQLSTERLSVILAVFLVSGAMASMISAPNPYWWQIHFSSLGGGETASAAAFNLTVIIGGLVIVGLADRMASEFRRWQAAGHRHARSKGGLARALIAAMGLCLAGVGLFPYDTNQALHNLAATLLGLLFFGLAGAQPWLAPGLPRTFYTFSYLMFGALAVCVWLWVGVGYFNVTGFELITAGIIFLWMVVFVRQVAAGTADARPN